MKTVLAAAAATLALSATPAAADVILDTGVVDPFDGGLVIGAQWVAVRFTVDRATVLTDVEGFLARQGESPGLTLAIRDEIAGGPGDRRFAGVGDIGTTPSWQGLHGLHWDIGPGAYWLAFEAPDRSFETIIGRPTRAAPFASAFPPDPYVVMGSFPFYGGAVRVTGDSAVPEPGTWALIILGFGLAGVSLRRRTISPRSGSRASP
ncbi:MAG TPA: PEPxxWA-CTERM sorting domain-containing protein [Phenylobacterium sp.]